MAQRKGMLAAANQFTPMTNKNVQNAETPMCLLKIQDLATPKLNKNSLSPKDDQKFRSPSIVPQTPATEIDVDTEVPSPKFSGIPESASLADVRSLLVAALNYVDNLQRMEDQRKASLVTVATQTTEGSTTATRKKRNSAGDDKIQPKVNERPRNEILQRQVEKPKRRESSKDKLSDKQEPLKPILKKKSQKITKEEQAPQRIDPLPFEDEVNDIDIAVNNLANARKPSRNASGTKSSSEDLTEMKTTSMSKKSSLGSTNSTWSTDSEGRSLQQRMHQMSIILRNLEMQLDDISTKQ